MKKTGFTLVGLIAVIWVMSIFILAALPSIRAMRKEVAQVQAQTDLKTIQIAIESYYKNKGIYPPEPGYQDTLIHAIPQFLFKYLYDPFADRKYAHYGYRLSSQYPSIAKYYVIYTDNMDGRHRQGQAWVTQDGVVTTEGRIIWLSNGHQR